MFHGWVRSAGKALAFAVALGALGATQAQAQTPLTVVRVAGVQTDDITPLVYAIRTGMFARAGLDVQSMPTNSGAATAAAVASGAYEVGKSSLLSLMNAHLRNLPLVVIAAGVVHETRNPFAKLVVARTNRTERAKTLTGRRSPSRRSTISARCRSIRGWRRTAAMRTPSTSSSCRSRRCSRQWSNIGSMRRSSSIRRSRRPCRAAKCARSARPMMPSPRSSCYPGGSRPLTTRPSIPT